MFNTIIFSIILASLFFGCNKKEWSSEEIIAVKFRYGNAGYRDEELNCALKIISTKYTSTEFLNELEIHKNDRRNRDFLDLTEVINNKCIPESFNEKYKTRMVGFWVKSGLSKDVSECLYGEVVKKYTYKEYNTLDRVSGHSQSNSNYLTFFLNAQKSCTEKK